jgi:hypothetical protein
MKIRIFLAAAAVAMVACPAFSQPLTSVVVTKGAESATVTGTKTVTAKVVAIDSTTRTVMLKDKKGRVVEVQVGEEARNFDQLKIGDVVTTEYRESMSLSLTKASGPRSASERTIEQRSTPGAKPGGTIGREVTIMADVIAVNPKAETVTLKGPQGNTVEVIVQDPEQMKNIRKGDQVQVVYTEALAISVTPSASK